MMKSKDCAVATALVLNGYLRANEGEGPGDKVHSDRDLAAAIRAIRAECHDWAENLSSTNAGLEPSDISVELLEANGGTVSRSPYNLVSAALSALSEAVDLAGPETVLADFQGRGGVLTRSEPAVEPKNADESGLLVDAANQLVAEIDAASERPHAKLAALRTIVSALNARDVDVESVVTAPQNW